MSSKALDDVLNERQSQKNNPNIGDSFDKTNTQNDWVAYISAYSGRAANKVLRNKKEEQKFRDNMVKTAALALAAVEAYDNGWC